MDRFIAVSIALALTVSAASGQEGILSRTGGLGQRRSRDPQRRGDRNRRGPDGCTGTRSAQPRKPPIGMG